MSLTRKTKLHFVVYQWKGNKLVVPSRSCKNESELQMERVTDFVWSVPLGLCDTGETLAIGPGEPDVLTVEAVLEGLDVFVVSGPLFDDHTALERAQREALGTEAPLYANLAP